MKSFGFAEVYRLDEVSAIAEIIFGKGLDKVSAIRQSSLHIATTDRTNHMYIARTKFMGSVAASGVSRAEVIALLSRYGIDRNSVRISKES